jgi:hypothetical protein
LSEEESEINDELKNEIIPKLNDENGVIYSILRSKFGFKLKGYYNYSGMPNLSGVKAGEKRPNFEEILARKDLWDLELKINEEIKEAIIFKLMDENNLTNN